MSKERFDEWDIDKAIQSIGILIDISCDLSKREGLNHAIEQANLMFKEDLSGLQKATIHYFVGNAWSGLRMLKHSNSETVWGWEQTEIENEILNFRLSNCYLDGGNNNPFFCQTNTNLGNALSHVGRFVDAIMHWDKVLQYNSSFGMALATKGQGLVSYAKSLYDKGHAGLFMKFAYASLKNGLESTILHPSARESFEYAVRDLETRADKKFLEKNYEMENYSLGNSKAEQEYRKWCLDNQLFVNPLNDLGSFNIAAQDILSCPSITTSIDDNSYDPPVYFAFYNQIKQEYVSARFLFYEGAQEQTPHYSDSGVMLYNTLDYPCYGLNTEKGKIAFRMVYSILDKIAFFVNEYLNLNIPEKKISFKTIWYEDQNKKKGLRKEFVNFKNWPLRGLFWLAKDLSENRQEFRESMEPDAKDVVSIRNHIEHKYMTISEYDTSDLTDFITHSQKKMYRTDRDSFYLKTLKLFKLVRAALIYLSLGVHIEERKKKSRTDGIIAPMPLGRYEDDWKI